MLSQLQEANQNASNLTYYMNAANQRVMQLEQQVRGERGRGREREGEGESASGAGGLGFGVWWRLVFATYLLPSTNAAVLCELSLLHGTHDPQRPTALESIGVGKPLGSSQRRNRVGAGLL